MSEWTRDDLPDPVILAGLIEGMKGATFTQSAVIVGAVVEHLNAHHPKPDDDDEGDTFPVRLRRQANTIAELQGVVNSWRRAHEIVELERDEWKARADKWHGAWQKSVPSPTVTREDVEKVVHGSGGGFFDSLLDEITDAVWHLVSGDDPAVFVVRESQLPDVERNEDGNWLCENTLVVNGKDTAEDLRGRALPQLRHLAMREAVARAIEAEQAVGPILDKAQEFAALADWELSDREAVLLHTVAAHILGQDASDE